MRCSHFQYRATRKECENWRKWSCVAGQRCMSYRCSDNKMQPLGLDIFTSRLGEAKECGDERVLNLVSTFKSLEVASIFLKSSHRRAVY